MSLQVNFSILQASDCSYLRFQDTTGDYDVTTNITGYESPNQPRSDVKLTVHNITMLDGTIEKVLTGYLPTLSTSTIDITAAQVGLTTWQDGSYIIEYKTYCDDILSGSITTGIEYVIVDASLLGYTVTYNGSTYSHGETFIGVVGITTYTESNAAVVVRKLESSISHYVLITCNIRSQLIALMITAVETKCSKSCDWAEELYLKVMELNSLSLAYNEGLRDCAVDALERLAWDTTDFYTKCCC